MRLRAVPRLVGVDLGKGPPAVSPVGAHVRRDARLQEQVAAQLHDRYSHTGRDLRGAIWRAGRMCRTNQPPAGHSGPAICAPPTGRTPTAPAGSHHTTWPSCTDVQPMRGAIAFARSQGHGQASPSGFISPARLDCVRADLGRTLPCRDQRRLGVLWNFFQYANSSSCTSRSTSSTRIRSRSCTSRTAWL
jgi:hypothetical protein